MSGGTHLSLDERERLAALKVEGLGCMPRRMAASMAQRFKVKNLLARVSITLAASYSAVRTIAPPALLIPPVTSVSPGGTATPPIRSGAGPLPHVWMAPGSQGEG